MCKQEYRLENTKVMEENTMQQTDEIEIDLWEICLVLVHNLALIVSVGIMTALGTFLITQLFITPKYESTTKIYILNKQENNAVTYSDIQLGTQLTKDYAELIQSRFVLEEVVQGMGLDLSYEEMKKKGISMSLPQLLQNLLELQMEGAVKQEGGYFFLSGEKL